MLFRSVFDENFGSSHLTISNGSNMTNHLTEKNTSLIIFSDKKIYFMTLIYLSLIVKFVVVTVIPSWTPRRQPRVRRGPLRSCLGPRNIETVDPKAFLLRH